MTNPVFFLSPQTLLTQFQAGDKVSLTGEEARHALGVRRLRLGENLDLVDGEGLRLRGRVEKILDKTHLEMRIDEVISEPGPETKLTLVQALAKSGRDEQGVEASVELGVDCVVAWQAERCVSRWEGEKAVKGIEKWRRNVREATKQSRRAYLSEVKGLFNTSQLCTWLEEQKPSQIFLLHEEAETTLAAELKKIGTRGFGQNIVVIVGPEGGVGQDECARLQAAGAKKLRLGPSIMRSSSAGPAALAILTLACGNWD